MKNWKVLCGAAFLMATSAVGPGFLTQTTVFTEKLGASFGFVILVSIIIDVAIQLNIWRILAVSGKRAQEISDQVLPGLGKVMTVLIAFGGLAFNIGNVAGAGMGLNALFDVSIQSGAIGAAVLSIAIFLMKDSKRIMDFFTLALGSLMLGLVLYVSFASSPPLKVALTQTFFPEHIDIITIVTLVGGTVGGYITFAGGHRLLDAGVTGKTRLKEVSTSAVSGILVASTIRIFLFLAVLGIISQGHSLDPSNPPASVFKLAAGEMGMRLFGLLMLFAAVTSVVGSAYTSVSFLKSFGKSIERNENLWIIGFILVSTIIFVTVGKPVSLLILAGALNGLIIPVTLGTILLAASKKSVVGEYRHPKWMTLFGIIVFVVMLGMSLLTLRDYFFNHYT